MVRHGFVPEDDIGTLNELQALWKRAEMGLHGTIIVNLLVIILLDRQLKERVRSGALASGIILCTQCSAAYAVDTARYASCIDRSGSNKSHEMLRDFCLSSTATAFQCEERSLSCLRLTQHR